MHIGTGEIPITLEGQVAKNAAYIATSASQDAKELIFEICELTYDELSATVTNEGAVRQGHQAVISAIGCYE